MSGPAPRWPRAALASVVLASVGGTVAMGGGITALRRAQSASCNDLPDARPTLEQLADLARRVRSYQSDLADDARLVLGPDDVDLVFDGGDGLQVDARSDGARLAADLTVPRGGVCYNVSFSGSVSVDEGVATVVPDRLVVGALDVSAIVSGMEFRLRPDQMPDPRLGDLLANTRSMRVDDGQIWLSMRDRAALR
jgi:hypothetical protein